MAPTAVARSTSPAGHVGAVVSGTGPVPATDAKTSSLPVGSPSTTSPADEANATVVPSAESCGPRVWGCCPWGAPPPTGSPSSSALTSVVSPVVRSCSHTCPAGHQRSCANSNSGGGGPHGTATGMPNAARCPSADSATSPDRGASEEATRSVVSPLPRSRTRSRCRLPSGLSLQATRPPSPLSAGSPTPVAGRSASSAGGSSPVRSNTCSPSTGPEPGAPKNPPERVATAATVPSPLSAQRSSDGSAATSATVRAVPAATSTATSSRPPAAVARS